MGKKWGRNEDIHVGDIFKCWSSDTILARPTYYQVTALRGYTQVVLHALQTEKYGFTGRDLYFLPEDTPPLPGKFMTEPDALWWYPAVEFEHRGKNIRITGEEVTAWVLPDRTVEGRIQLQEVGYLWYRRGWYFYVLALPEDWAFWTPERAKLIVDYNRACSEARKKYNEGDRDVIWPEYPL